MHNLPLSQQVRRRARKTGTQSEFKNCRMIYFLLFYYTREREEIEKERRDRKRDIERAGDRKKETKTELYIPFQPKQNNYIFV